ncbi:hypothetical protein ACF0H5_007286 [Mactra antiquata]
MVKLELWKRSEWFLPACTFATQANCPNFLPNSYCNIADGVCECPTVAGYVDDGSGIACTYDCGALGAPTNGAVDTSGGTYTGDVATYSCNNGYKVNGGSTSTCVADSGWDNTATTCAPGVLGDDCSANIFLCMNIPFGTCDFTSCVCQAGYEDDGTGTACSEIDECATNPCQNGATCTDALGSYSCACVPGYEGGDCETNIDECATNPCQNGATCVDGINTYTCNCVNGYDGGDCENNIDDCSPNPCQNGGLCLDGIASYLCSCAAGYEGDDCEINIDECATNPCQNGATCIDGINDYTCNCVAGYEDKNCATNINECIGNVCQNGATCVDGINQYTCTCVAGYDGTFCENDINECLTHVCQNGATCIDAVNTYSCLCVAGYDGTYCSNNIDDCDPSPCQNGATCVDAVDDYSCTCVAGYTDKNCQTNINECATNPCLNGATCVDGINDYTCNCVAGYEDKNCQTDTDECATNNCQNGATCIDAINAYSCVCASGYEGVFCQDDTDECVDSICQNGALCVDGIDGYTCDCLNGYNGIYCQNNINECIGNICENGATCVDGIDGYTCTCLPGYEGTYCSINTDECATHSCANGATCVDGVNIYTCTCVAGYDGTLCDNNINECASNPCLNGATCTDGVNKYTCTCVAGYVGTNCETDFDECAANPCVNGATCIDEIDDYTCLCLPGYSSKTCGIDDDDCSSDPCQNGATCIDAVNDYSCTCVAGYDGPNCENNIDECAGNVCENGATCVDGINTYTCTCVPGYNGTFCGNEIDECATHSCQNGATCVDEINGYTCLCVAGYVDEFCQTDFNECESSPCLNDGTCTDEVNGFTCTCASGFTGETCRPGELGDDCSIRAEVCDNIAYAECAGSVCTCLLGFEEDSGAPGTCTRVDCGTIVPPVDGSVDHTEDVVYESKAYFSCDDGYTLGGVTSVTCQSDATWDGVAPTCTIKDCGTLSNIANGVLVYTPDTLYQSLAEFSCNTGYTLVGDVSRTCLSSGVWGGNSPICEINDCGTINAPSNGEVDQTDGTTYLAVTTFQCNNGYTLNGESSLTCQADGTWDNFKPVCNIKDCGFLSDPTNGVVDQSEGSEYLANAYYACNTGYTLVGSSSRRCQASGEWSSVEPVCQINDCGVLSDPSFGDVDITAGTQYGDIATYSCDSGFELDGVIERTCQSDGTWSGVAPTCERLNCGNLKAPTYGTVDLDEGTLFEATAYFECNPGYTLMGDTTRYCTDIGDWDNASPTCIIKDCGSLTDPEFGQVLTVFGTTYGEVAEYTCIMGYQINGVSTRTCLDTGLWGASEPTCVILDCGPVANISNGDISYSTGTIYGSTVTYSCVDGYEVSGVGTRVCQATGDWSDNQPSCAILDCDEATAISNGVARTPSGSQVGDVAIYECNSGYGLVGNAEVICEPSGFWGTVPECRLDCGNPPNIDNGNRTYPAGTLVAATSTYTCHAGYYISGDSVITCQSTGSWTNEPFCFIIHRNYEELCSVTAQCVTVGSSCRDDGAGNDRCLCSLSGQVYDPSIDECLADCGGLVAPTNGIITLPAVYSAGQIAVYSCDRGYALSGPAIRTCTVSGAWNGSAPQCVAGCPDPEAPANGNVDTSQGTASGDAITYTCDAGYALIGAAKRECNSDSTWNNAAPTCAIECAPLGDITDGWVDMALGRFEGSKAVYVCRNNYALVGEGTRTCQSTGLWDGVEPECVFAIFPDVLLVFGSLFVFLVLVDIAIIGFCIYIKYCKKETKYKDPNYPEILDEEEETGVPPPAFLEPSKQFMEKKAMEKEKERRSKFAKVVPETRKEILRMDDHPKPKAGPNVKVKRNAKFGGFDKEAFFQKFKVSRRKEPKPEVETVQPMPESERSNNDVHIPSFDDITVPPNTVQQQAMQGLRSETTHHLPNDDFLRDGGYGTANSDESNARIIDEDQLSLDDLTPHNNFPETSSITPKETKRTGEDFGQKFKGRIPLPQVTDTGIHVERETEKPYNDKERKHMKNSVLTYSPIMRHK